MNTFRAYWLFVAFLLNPLPLDAAEFQNLNFEQATIAPTPPGAFGTAPADANATFPGWTVGSGMTIHNNLTLGTPAQVLVGPQFPNGINLNPLEGAYSALIQFGPQPEFGRPSLSQVGLVPPDARSISFLISPTMNDAYLSLDITK